MIQITVTRICPSRAKLIQYLLDIGWYQKFETPSYDVHVGFEDYSNGVYFVEIPFRQDALEAYMQSIIIALSNMLDEDPLDIYNGIYMTIPQE